MSIKSNININKCKTKIQLIIRINNDRLGSKLQQSSHALNKNSNYLRCFLIDFT